jgi:hypothetical protein
MNDAKEGKPDASLSSSLLEAKQQAGEMIAERSANC